VLGCTHFPVLAPAIAAVVGPRVAIVDASDAVAAELKKRLAALELLAPTGPGGLELLATDGAERFARVGATFVGQPIEPADVRLVDL
jgi:glutamate racemase